MASTRKATRKGNRKASSRKTTRKASSRKASSWAMSVKRVYGELKRKDRNASLRDAMMEASKRRKAGTL
jgi:hypothetical protein